MNEQTLDRMAAEERRAYQKEWKAKNKDKVREQNARYWRNRALKRMKEQQEQDSD